MLFSSRINEIAFLAFLLAALPISAQYPRQVAKSSKEAPELRSIAVLEWTGEAGNPKASRLVPVAVLDQGQLQDGAIYLVRPQPLALAGEVEYELEQNGLAVGLFDIKNAGQEQGSWVGYGAWKPLAKPQPKPSAEELAHIEIEDEDAESDRPILHRKHHADEDAAGANQESENPASASPSPDPDRPVLKKNSKKPAEDMGHVDSLPDGSAPDRPRPKRGRSTGNGLEVLPSLMGMPADMRQTVAVSDARTRSEHAWSYSWANPEDEAAMKASLEETARGLLGLNLPPAPLVDENYRAFGLAYNSGATLVLTARTDGPLAEQKFVTLIAQPDLYGNLMVLLKYVASGAHLDDTPRMRLVDAVDALADNRGELLFELRGATQRQFVLYRILRGQAEKLFVSAGAEFGNQNRLP
jgi:hypothetical protein